MKKDQFEFNELPYPTLARFGLTQEMIEDLPLRILKEIGKGSRYQSPKRIFQSRENVVY